MKQTMTMREKIKLVSRIMDVATYAKLEGMRLHEAVEAIRKSAQKHSIPLTNRELRRAVTNVYKSAIAVLVMAAASVTLAGDKDKTVDVKKEREPNYILRRQEAGLVRGTPIRSFYIDHRRIDFYRDGSAFEKDYRVK